MHRIAVRPLRGLFLDIEHLLSPPKNMYQTIQDSEMEPLLHMHTKQIQNCEPT